MDLIELNKCHMRQTFHNPTRWTLNAFYFRRATRRLQIKIQRKFATVRKDYLLRQVEGGPRHKTGLERLLNAGYVVPTKHARNNKHGNVSPGQIQKVLSGLKAQGDAAQNEPKTPPGRKRRSNAARYFTPRAGGRMTPGIYERKGRKAPQKIFAFTDKPPSYRKAFKFYPKITAAPAPPLPRHFYRALARAFATRRR
ncbi:hypothetical protein [Pseudophaeobacter leonis]|uniref:hypothetical protein n=1 Tax=Pseudophaeobacter leonis TaxID=1144477 RepID=UPI00111BDF21|nr:hypothetical protein [Pseudophaeobacter leonis]